MGESERIAEGGSGTVSVANAERHAVAESLTAALERVRRIKCPCCNGGYKRDTSNRATRSYGAPNIVCPGVARRTLGNSASNGSEVDGTIRVDRVHE